MGVSLKEFEMSKVWTSAALVSGLFALAGCGGQSSAPVAGTGAKPPEVADEQATHSGWWCDEHGIKEAECSMCNAKVAKAFQDKGDWCEKHNRAESQCYICNPKLKDKYAAEYRAKYGKEPPEPEGQKPEPEAGAAKP